MLNSSPWKIRLSKVWRILGLVTGTAHIVIKQTTFPDGLLQCDTGSPNFRLNNSFKEIKHSQKTFICVFYHIRNDSSFQFCIFYRFNLAKRFNLYRYYICIYFPSVRVDFIQLLCIVLSQFWGIPQMAAHPWTIKWILALCVTMIDDFWIPVCVIVYKWKIASTAIPYICLKARFYRESVHIYFKRQLLYFYGTSRERSRAKIVSGGWCAKIVTVCGGWADKK